MTIATYAQITADFTPAEKRVLLSQNSERLYGISAATISGAKARTILTPVNAHPRARAWGDCKNAYAYPYVTVAVILAPNNHI